MCNWAARGLCAVVQQAMCPSKIVIAQVLQWHPWQRRAFARGTEVIVAEHQCLSELQSYLCMLAHSATTLQAALCYPLYNWVYVA